MLISRHARNNMRLYRIRQRDLEAALQAPDRSEREGRYHVVYKTFPGRFRDKPLKVVYAVEEDTVIITTYPLQRTYRR